MECEECGRWGFGRQCIHCELSREIRNLKEELASLDATVLGLAQFVLRLRCPCDVQTAE